ncbi:hypothetical protein GQ44DRAFT_667862 [Phaeosphaeriaceae sp. PMI808]|nr:hypothetical protein GQ44DRAFT_667862 [Phaeosphaeriaceae sp. PMI808]
MPTSKNNVKLRIPKWLKGVFLKRWKSLGPLLNRCWVKVRESIVRGENSQDTCPRFHTAILALFLLLIFLVTAVFALIFPTMKLKLLVILVNSILVGILTIVFAVDLATKRNRNYEKNLANTVLTVLFTIVVLTTTYTKIWYHGLNDVVLRQETDYIHTPRFPAVAFFQGQDSAQAEIVTGELKCSSGPRDDRAIQCSSLSIQEALKTPSCDCGDSWPSLETLNNRANTVLWLTKNTSYYAMVPYPTTISKGVGHFLEMQVFFKYNARDAYSNASLTPSPGIWMAIYDPSYDLIEMMVEGQLYTVQIDANSHTVVDIGLVYYTYLNKASNYKYLTCSEVTVSTRQNLDLVCDVSKPDWYLCHLTVELEIPSFLRRVVREEKRQDWSRVVADAGAYFALVQFLSWIASGMAWSI